MSKLYPIRLLHEHQYAILDQVSTQDNGQDWPIMPLVPRGLEREAHLLPALVPLQKMISKQKENLFVALDHAQQTGEAMPIVTFLASDIDLESMRQHWVNQLIMLLPRGERVLLRSYDPRVFTQLQWILSPGQLSQLHGPIAKWTIYHEHTWLSFAKPEKTPCSGGQINLDQMQRLAHIGQVNQVLAKIQGPHWPELEKTSQKIIALIYSCRLRHD